MSGAVLSGLGVGAMVAADVAGVFVRTRTFNGLIPDCTIEERHTDRLEITQHPVEQGAMITDHAYVLPQEVMLRYGWTDSGLFNLNFLENISSVGSFLGVKGNATYTDQIYQQLLEMQSNREPFAILTGKRRYANMLIAEISCTTDVRTENALIVEILCREVILVSTSSAALPSDPSAHADPSTTQPPVNSGPQQTIPSSSGPTLDLSP